MTARNAVVGALLLGWAVPALAVAQPATDTQAGPQPPQAETQEEPSENDSDGYAPAETPEPWSWSGYLDLGFADAQGGGTSFHPQDTLLPADYGVDAFAPAVNSRGDVASIDTRSADAPDGRFTNGFLPRSLGIGGRPSVFLSTASFDLRYAAPGSPVMVFSRVQLMPRFGTGGSDTGVLVEQAFGRIVPFDSLEMALSLGKFDSVFGIEYLDNQAPLRTGITPSLLARYTTGPPVGAKLFFRQQIARLWSALSLNATVTNGPPFVEALQPAEVSLTGRPVVSARVGYELNLPRVQLKLGTSAMTGPRNDQGDPRARQQALGADARLYLYGVTLSGEYLRVDQDDGTAWDKRTGAGAQTYPSRFRARGLYAQIAYQLPWSHRVLRRTTLYARGEQRHARFGGFRAITVRRLTGGLRLDLWDGVALKGEYLANRETEGAPTVANDVVAASLVFGF